MHGEHEKGRPWFRPTGDSVGGTAMVSNGSAAARAGGTTCPHSGAASMSGDRLAVGEGGRRDRRGVCVGPPGKDEVGRAWMNSVDCELFKWISNEFDLI
jgi:hypothetical protein